MWKLNTPDIGDAEADLIRALTRANGEPVFETNAEQRAALLQLYQQYDLERGKPSNELRGTNLDAAFVGAVYSAYDQVQEGRRWSSTIRSAGRVASRNFLTSCLAEILTVGAGSWVLSGAGSEVSRDLSHIVLAQRSLTPEASEVLTEWCWL
jgi:hypothetical protein